MDNNNSISLIAIIDTYKGRDIAIVDIKGEYLNTKISKFLINKLVDE